MDGAGTIFDKLEQKLSALGVEADIGNLQKASAEYDVKIANNPADLDSKMIGLELKVVMLARLLKRRDRRPGSPRRRNGGPGGSAAGIRGSGGSGRGGRPGEEGQAAPAEPGHGHHRGDRRRARGQRHRSGQPRTAGRQQGRREEGREEVRLHPGHRRRAGHGRRESPEVISQELARLLASPSSGQILSFFMNHGVSHDVAFWINQ